jgi:hypothetical protein
MDQFKPRIAALVKEIQKCIDSSGGEPVNVTDVMTWFSFDAMGEVIFGKDFCMIKDRATNSIMVQQRRALALLGPLIDVPWVVHLAFAFFPYLGKVRDFMNMCTFCEQQIEKRMAVRP